MPAALELKNVKKSFFLNNAELRILHGIDMSVASGEFLAIMGPSGSGKSTLLHIMGGLDQATSGEVVIGGRDITHYDDVALARLRNELLGFVFQNFYLLNYYSAFQNVCLPLHYSGFRAEKERYARRLLQTVGLGHRMNHRPQTLSGGERQRVAIARALVNQPLILFADEPTGNLDTKTGHLIMEMLATINKKGTTVVLITHDPQIAKHAHRTIHIEDGRVF